MKNTIPEINTSQPHRDDKIPGTRRASGCLTSILVLFGLSALVFTGSYFWLKKLGVVDGVEKVSGFIADQVKKENETKRIEQERRANLSPDERAREDSFLLEKERLKLQLTKEEAKNVASEKSEFPNEELKASFGTAIEMLKAENERRANLSSDERAREDALRADAQRRAMDAFGKMGTFTADQIKKERDNKLLENERRAKLTPEERAREDAIEIEKLRIKN